MFISQISSMYIIEELKKEFESEFNITKRFIESYPDDKNDWKPHEKSMSMKVLSVHIVEIFGWPKFIMQTDFLDFGESPYKQADLNTQSEMMKLLEDNFAKNLEILKQLQPEDLDGSWDIRQGDMVFQKWSKYGAIRHAFQQITHHRAQLGVYYRLNDIPVPRSYGPSADDQSF